MLIQLGRNDIRLDFFKMLKRRFDAYYKHKYKVNTSIFKSKILNPDDFAVHIWITGTLDLLTDNAWYEPDGRHARRIRSYWQHYAKKGGTPPWEITDNYYAIMKRGEHLFMSGVVKFD